MFTGKTGLILSRILKGGDVLLMTGELGAGKTTFISGIAEGLGIKENLTSPSFAIINLYDIDSKKKFIHADFYRLDSADEIINTGIEDFLYSGRNIVCIEWGDRFKDFLNSCYLEVRFEYFYPSGNRSPAEDALPYCGKSNSDFINPEDRVISFDNPAACPYWDRKLQIFKKSLERQKCIFSE